MELYLLKSFHFREYEKLPYRTDGKGGHVFHGVGSHVLFSNLRHRWYSFAFEVATVDQAPDNHLETVRIRGQCDGHSIEVRQDTLKFHPDARQATLDPRISSIKWIQHLEIDAEKPSLIELFIDMQFSERDDWLTVEGSTRVLVDLHVGDPPRHHGKLGWFLRRLRGRQD